MISFIKKILFPRRVRVIYTLGLHIVPDKVREYIIDGKSIIAAEKYDLATNERLKYKVNSKNCVKIFVPLLFGFKPFRLHDNGYLSPDFDCRGRGNIVDYMYWIPLDYKENMLRKEYHG